MLKNFKANWEITQNWQLLFPLFGLLGILYSSYRIASLLDLNIVFTSLIALVASFLLLRIILFVFKKLENRWIVDQRWEMIRIFIVFAITGSSSALLSRPLLRLIGITKENLNDFMYYILYVIVSLIIYQILLVFFGWVLGQFKFFWEFEKKMLRRFGLSRFLD